MAISSNEVAPVYGMVLNSGLPQFGLPLFFAIHISSAALMLGVDYLAFRRPDAHAPVLFQFALRVLHFGIPIGREFRTDLVIRSRTGLDVFARPRLTNFFKTLSDVAIRGRSTSGGMCSC